MNFLLTVYVCSIVNSTCAIAPPDLIPYKQEYGTHYGCVMSGIESSYKILFDGKHFSANVVETQELYPRFTCEKVTSKHLTSY